MRRVVLAALLLTACRDTTSVRVAWEWAAPAPAYVGMPAADQRHVAATFGHAAVVLLDARGRLQWKTAHLGVRDVAPALTADSVLVPTDDGLVAFDRAEGALRWTRRLGDRASTPLVNGDRVVVTLWRGEVIALDRWSIALPGPSLGPPAGADGVVVAAWDTGVLAVGLDRGEVLWQHDFDATGTSAPAAAGGLAVVVAGDRRAHAFDLRTGAERWSFPTAGAGSPEAPPAIGGGRVAVADRLGHVTVADLTTGTVDWTVDARGAVWRGGPRFAGPDTIAIPLDDGRLLVATDTKRIERDPSGRVSGVAVGHGGTVVYATREAGTNRLTALQI